jgi:hypothetical protein
MRQKLALTAITGTLCWLAAAGTAHAQTCAPPGTASTACSGNCAKITVATVSGKPGNTVDIPISFDQGPDDGQAGQGFDEVAAIAFTLGVPGSGAATPLTFDCNADGTPADGTVTVAPGIASNFAVVLENAQCTNRTHCLCPNTSAVPPQTRDNYVNVVVYGPPNLPAQGPVQIPVLPASGTIVTLTMRVAADAPSSVPLHVYSSLDNGSPAKPQFAANFSIGDPAACDVTANTQNRSNVIFVDGKVNAGTACVGDCDGNGMVGINELIKGVNIALDEAAPSTCVAFQNAQGMVNIAQLIKGVNNALNGCGSAS